MRNAGLYFQTFKGRDEWAWMGSGGEFSVYVCVCVVVGVLAGWLNDLLFFLEASLLWGHKHRNEAATQLGYKI